MNALVFDRQLHLVANRPLPRAGKGWALIRVNLAGICRTDLEITKGYMAFRGVLGHEFVGTVTRCAEPGWVGRRVVGEINAACGKCAFCRQHLGRHCPNRSVLGIQSLDGCMAEYCKLPVDNLHRVPDAMRDEQAVFIEPLAAACEILDQVKIRPASRCVVLGDGKLGILCAWVLSTVSHDVTLAGRHADKLALARWKGLKISLANRPLEAADIVVEATGRPEGLAQAMTLCRPRGTIVLKSTLADAGRLNLAPVVIHELTLVGSRCGRFKAALASWSRHRFPLQRLITARYPLAAAPKAMAYAARRGSLKILIDMG